jgi:hypothetical protein
MRTDEGGRFNPLYPCNYVSVPIINTKRRFKPQKEQQIEGKCFYSFFSFFRLKRFLERPEFFHLEYLTE